MSSLHHFGLWHLCKMLSQSAIFPLALLALLRKTEPHWFPFPPPVLLRQVQSNSTSDGPALEWGQAMAAPPVGLQATSCNSSQPVTSTCLLNTLIPQYSTHVCARNLRERCSWKCSALSIKSNSAQVVEAGTMWVQANRGQGRRDAECECAPND